jgi:hypothetical protein
MTNCDLLRICSSNSGHRCAAKGEDMADWQKLAEEALENEKEPVAAEAASISTNTTAIVATVGLIASGVLVLIEPLEEKPAAIVISAAAIIAAATVAVALIVASDFRTRGSVTQARLAALAQLATASTVQSPSNVSFSDVVPSVEMKAKAGGESYRVLAIRSEGQSEEPAFYLLWQSDAKAKWFAAHDVDSILAV